MAISVKCNLQQCFWNRNEWCYRTVVSLKNGMCSQLMSSSGAQIDPKYWQNPSFDEDDPNIETPLEDQ